jgi:hypothetical protein
MKNNYLTIILLFSVYILQAQIVNIPDVNFKYALVNFNVVDINGDGIGDADVDLNNDGEIQVSEAEIVQILFVPINYNIYSIEGIENFTSLVEIYTSHNPLSNIDFSQNINLEIIYINDCDFLTSLNVSQNPNLTIINCRYSAIENMNAPLSLNLRELWLARNNLSDLDVSQNINLEILSIFGNPISELDVTQNINLKMLSMDDTNISTLDLTQNPNLERLICSSNNITVLDLSQNHNLNEVYVQNNPLVSLNIKNGNNYNLTLMKADNNPNLNCIEVDDENYANAQTCDVFLGWCKDINATYNEECILEINDIRNVDHITFYPNPVTKLMNLNIDSNISIISMNIYNINGDLVFMEENYFEQIDLSSLNTGLYLVKVETEKIIITKKILKD